MTPATTRATAAGPGELVGPARPLRADARRNRQRILDAAAASFAEEGLAVPIDRIATRAGVGVGTLYRHFPTKDALFEAIVVDRIDGLLGRVDELSHGADAGGAFFTFVAEMVVLATDHKDLLEELGRRQADAPGLKVEVKARLEAAVGRLLREAQAAGAVRGAVDVVEVMCLLMGVCAAAVHAGPTGLVRVVCDGLRPRQ